MKDKITNKKIFAFFIATYITVMFCFLQYNFIKNGIITLFDANIEEDIENNILGKDVLREINGLSNKLLSPNEISTDNYVIVKNNDGYLEILNNVSDSTYEYVKNSILNLSNYCKNNNIDFLYVSYPSKTNSSSIASNYGVETNYEEKRSSFLKYLKKENIECLDIRAIFENYGYSTCDIFYKTDHHWKTVFGLKAAQEILNYLNTTKNFGADIDILNMQNFSFTNYSNFWFGETGRKVSLTWSGSLDDYTLIEPLFDTSITLIYSEGNNINGDFSSLIDYDSLYGAKNLYDFSAHYSYSKGLITPVNYHNNLAKNNNKKTLYIIDSFSVNVIPFICLATSDTYVWDVRDEHNISLKEYITNNDIKNVILAYTDFWSEYMWDFK